MRDSTLLTMPYGECDPGQRDEPKITCSGCGAIINLSESAEHGDECRLCEKCEAELKETFERIDDLGELSDIFFKEFKNIYGKEIA